MANMRIIGDNAIHRCNLVTGSGSVGDMVVSNVTKLSKSLVHRIAGTVSVYTLRWLSGETLSGLALGLGNQTPTATVRVVLYGISASTVIFDSGHVLGCPGPAISLAGFTANQALNAYAQGGGVYSEVWFGQEWPGVYRAEITVTDTANPQGYVEVSGITIGAYWEAAKNVDYGATVTATDTGKNTRTDSGDLPTTMGTRGKKMTLPMSKLDLSDSAALYRILRSNGIGWPVYISLDPDASVSQEWRQRHQIRGKLVETPSMAYPSFNIATATLNIESI